jgi:hypothetical protein
MTRPTIALLLTLTLGFLMASPTAEAQRLGKIPHSIGFRGKVLSPSRLA